MEQIEQPSTTSRATDAVLAQTVAADAGWHQDSSTSAIYDAAGEYLAADLSELGRIMRGLQWFVPTDAAATGVWWSQLPDDPAQWSPRVISRR